MVFVSSTMVIAASRTLCGPNNVGYCYEFRKIVKTQDFVQYLLDSIEHSIDIPAGLLSAMSTC